MKILWINKKASLQGGAEQYIFNTIKELKNFNIKSSLLYDANEDDQEEFLDVFEEAYPFVSTYEQIINIKPDLIYIHQLDEYEVLKEIIKTKIPTVRFFHDHKLFCLREHKYTTLKKNTCTKKLGLSCYGCLGFINKEDNLFGFSINSLGKLKKLQDLNKKIDHFIVASEYMKNHITLHGFNMDKITINPLYASNEFKYSKNTDFTKNKTLLFVGQLLTGKGLDSLLQIMPEINEEYNLAVVGDGKQREKLEELAKKLNISHRVDFLGKLSQKELLMVYKKSYCLIIPSRAPETFNLVGVEAQKVGLPIIASNVGGISQWLKQKVNGLLVNANDTMDLKNKLKMLIEDKSLHYKISHNIYKNDFYEHDSKAHAKMLIDTFKKNLGVNHV